MTNFLEVQPNQISILAQDEFLLSANGRYQLIMQGDGNLVVYDGRVSDQSPKSPWSTGAKGSGPKYMMALQSDGNLCVYHNIAAPPADWCSMPKSRKPSAAYVLIMQDDGNVIVGAGSYAAVNAVVWSSHGGVTLWPYCVSLFAPGTRNVIHRNQVKAFDHEEAALKAFNILWEYREIHGKYSADDEVDVQPGPC